QRCGLPAARAWGLSAQLYSLRRADPAPAGVGDFGALAELARHAGARGCDALAISPVHAMFSADLERDSPYSPSSRLWLNVLYIDPFEAFSPTVVQAAIRALKLDAALLELEAASLIDWPRVAAARLQLLRALFKGF